MHVHDYMTDSWGGPNIFWLNPPACLHSHLIFRFPFRKAGILTWILSFSGVESSTTVFSCKTKPRFLENFRMGVVGPPAWVSTGIGSARLSLGMFIWFLFGISSSPTSTADIINCKIWRWHISETRPAIKIVYFLNTLSENATNFRGNIGITYKN